MANEIRAGRAFLELTVKDTRFAAGLQAASNKLRSWGRSLTIVGAQISAIGGAILAPIAVSIRTFSQLGDQLTDMSARTGVSVEALSQLGYAAEQSGTDIETLEKIIGIMQRSLSGLAKTNEQTGKAFRTLGISLTELRRLSPDEQLKKLLDAIGNLPDAATKAGVAMTLFGRGGRAILPLIGNWAELSAEAEHFNLTISKEAANRGDKLGDTFNLLGRTFRALRFAIGDAFSDVLTRGLRIMAELVAVSIDWAKANKGLVVAVGAVGLAISALGAAVTSLGLSLVIGSIAMSGILSAVSALLSPFALIAATVTAAAYAFLRFTSIGQAVVSFLAGKFQLLFKIASETFSAIGDALSGGDIIAAANVLWAGLKLAWVVGTKELTDTWIQFRDIAARTFIELSAQVQSIWVKLIAFLKGGWIEFQRFWLDSLDLVIFKLAGIGESDAVKAELQKKLDKNIIDRENAARADTKSIEQNKKAQLDAIDATRKQSQSARDAAFNDEMAKAKTARDAAQQKFDATRKAAADARAKGFGGDLAAQFAGVNGIVASAQGLTRSTFSGKLAPQVFGGGAPDRIAQKQLEKQTRMEKHLAIIARQKAADARNGIPVGDK